MSSETFEQVWAAIEDDPRKGEIYKLRSEAMHTIAKHIRPNEPRQREVAGMLGISQRRVSKLLKRDFESFRLDTLVGFAVRCGHKVSIDIA